MHLHKQHYIHPAWFKIVMYIMIQTVMHVYCNLQLQIIWGGVHNRPGCLIRIYILLYYNIFSVLSIMVNKG
jgi:hypothetical protein